MAAVPETTLNWLYSVLTSVIRPHLYLRPAFSTNAHRAQNYADVNRTYHDAAEALSHYPSLAVHTEVYSTPLPTLRRFADRTEHT
jgi:ESCRT-I complex subunit TSG101